MDPERNAESRRRIYWMAAARATLCLFAAAIIRLNVGSLRAEGQALPYATVGAALAANTLYAALTLTRLSWRFNVALQTVADVIFITSLVCATGGAASDFRLLYFGPILASAVLFRRSTALLVASFATIAFFASSALLALEKTPPIYVDEMWLARQPGSPSALVANIVLQAAAFHLVAYLAATLTLRLRSASIETEHILENMSDGVITVGRDARVVFANARARQMLAVERGRGLVGRSLAEVAPPTAASAFVEVMSSPKTACVDLALGGNPAQATVLPILDSASRLRGANIVFHDLTDRQRLVEALRRADRLEATAATVASIAHEIRNPLAAIRGSAQELKKALQPPGPDGKLLDLVVRESDRLNRILTEFLNFSRMPKPRMGRLDLRELLDEVAGQLRLGCGSTQPRVTVSGADAAGLSGDGEQLRQVFINLGLNALDATGGAGPVAFDVAREDGGIAVRTRDRGCGIPGDAAEKVFEPFFTTKTTGTGLGLPIARRIVEEHGGKIDIENDGEGWTCVKVFLPLAERERVSSAKASGGTS